MNAKKMYRIELNSDYSYLCQQIVLMAARSNGSNKDYKPISELKIIAETLQLTQPDYIVEQVGENILHIDLKKGEKFINVLRLEEVEVLQLIDEEAVTLNRYATGIADTQNHEAIN